MAGDRELLSVDLLCNGQRKGIPILIAALFVGRNGIMDLCFHTIFKKVFLQSVALGAENGEDVIDTIARSEARTRILFRGGEK